MIQQHLEAYDYLGPIFAFVLFFLSIYILTNVWCTGCLIRALSDPIMPPFLGCVCWRRTVTLCHYDDPRKKGAEEDELMRVESAESSVTLGNTDNYKKRKPAKPHNKHKDKDTKKSPEKSPGKSPKKNGSPPSSPKNDDA